MKSSGTMMMMTRGRKISHIRSERRTYLRRVLELVVGTV
jgi:hypothetical protein